MAKQVLVTAKKIKQRKKLLKFAQFGIFGTLAAMTSMFMVLSLVYNGGKFSIDLDKELAEEKGIILYEDSITKTPSRKLYADDLQYMDNISINWIPKDIDNEGDGAHNGDNYIAYTYYIENQGIEPITYWYTLYIDDVIKNVDEATRIMIFRNGEKKLYAKLNATTNEPEKDTIPFYSDEVAVLEQRLGLQPNEYDKFTIVVWLEGDDPDCINKIIGGEIKLHMEINQERIG